MIIVLASSSMIDAMFLGSLTKYQGMEADAPTKIAEAKTSSGSL